MKILHVAHSFLPYSLGGVETYLYHLARAQALEGNVAVFHPVFTGTQVQYTVTRGELNGVRTYAIEMGGEPRVPFGELYDGVLLSRFQETIREYVPEVIHYHSLINLSMGLLSPDVPVAKVFTVHDFWLMCQRVVLFRTDESLCRGPEGGLLCVTCRDPAKPTPHHMASLVDRFFELRRRVVSYNFARMQFNDRVFQQQFRQSFARDKARQVDRWIALSRLWHEMYLNWGIEPERIQHSKLGIDTTSITSRPDRVLNPTTPVRFGFIGRVERLKGVETLLGAFNQISAPNAELRLYGKFTPDSYESHIRNLAKHANVEFMGAFHPADLPRVLSHMDVLVLPSIHYENCPMVVLEARAAGVPAIVSDIGGGAELVTPGQDGWHFARADASSLAALLEHIATHPEQINAMRASLPPVKTVKENARELEQVYADAKVSFVRRTP